jgi:hypothetical protein
METGLDESRWKQKKQEGIKGTREGGKKMQQKQSAHATPVPLCGSNSESGRAAQSSRSFLHGKGKRDDEIDEILRWSNH